MCALRCLLGHACSLLCHLGAARPQLQQLRLTVTLMFCLQAGSHVAANVDKASCPTRSSTRPVASAPCTLRSDSDFGGDFSHICEFCGKLHEDAAER